MDDYKYLRHNKNLQVNAVAIQAQQTVEKLLKSVLECLQIDDEDLYYSHNITKIYSKIESSDVDFNLDFRILSELKDTYFEDRYPNKSYKDLSSEKLKSFVELADNLVTKVNMFRKENGLHVKEVKVDLAEVSIEDIFKSYRLKYNIKTEYEWAMEYIRLSDLCKSKDTNVIAELIKNNFL